MHSPMKHAKKTRKNTFSQVAVAQSEVGDFQGGYFVMPDATSSKENDCPYRTRAPNSRTAIERSPARRKHQTNDSTSSPHKERPTQRFEHDSKKPFAEMSADTKKENSFRNEPTAPYGSYSSPKKSAPASPKHQHMDYSDQKYSSPCKDILSTSPSSSAGRWAGPAFGNAPHPSSLPLPEFPPMWDSSIATPQSSSVSTPSHFLTQDSYLSKSPPVHDGSYHGMVYHQHAHPFPMSTSPPLTSIPVVPFPYVGAQPPPVPHPSLAQLSTDLRRMLNIAGPVPGPIMSDPIMISANSA